MKEKAARNEEFVQQDRQFHRILYYSTGNVLLEQLLGAFWDLYTQSPVEPHHRDLKEVAEQHEKILDAFARHDLDLLLQLMREQFADARYRIVVSLMGGKGKKTGE
jgi:DNA-binding FadR family transcriptional regulator